MGTTTRLAFLLTCTLPLMACAKSAAETPGEADPVITRVDDSRIPYPTSRIEGRLSLPDGCLMINDAVAFWPAGATWDADHRKVVFGGDFHGAPSATVGAEFVGGGGVWGARDDLSGVLDDDAEAAVRGCMAKTSATTATLVYPAAIESESTLAESSISAVPKYPPRQTDQRKERAL